MATATVTFVGTGEACDPDLPNTSLLHTGSRTLLMDCGYGVPHAYWRLHRDPDHLDGIFISHLHADHSFGLPNLLLWMSLRGRTRPLSVFGGPGLERWLQGLLDLAYPGTFQPDRGFEIEPIPLRPGAVKTWGPLQLETAQSNHKVRNLALRVDDDGASVGYSGDGGPTSGTIELFSHVGLLVHECFALEPGVAGHANLNELLPVVHSIAPAELALLHLGVDDKEAITAYARTSEWPFDIIVPAPGEVIELESRKD